MQDNVLLKELPDKPASYAAVRAKIDEMEDPQSTFGYTAFSIYRHRDKLLTPTQRKSFEALLESKSTRDVDWHDVRNIVRIRALIELWKYAEETDPEMVTQRKNTWESWTDQRMDYMLQEFVANEKYQRSVWNLLSEDQIRKLRAGEWDEYLKKKTGHQQLFSADKQLKKILGQPKHQQAFEEVVEKWKIRWEAMREKIRAASLMQRKAEFSKDLATEPFVLHLWADGYAVQFRNFATHERDVIRELLQAGYDLDEATRAKLVAYRDSLKKKTLKKFADSPAELLKVLGEPVE